MSESDYPAGAFHDDDAPFNEGLKSKRRRPRMVVKKYKFKCSGCGTNFSSSLITPPPSPNWDDGHVCVMTPIEETECNEDGSPLEK
jgi:hypothetical protein